MHFTHKNNVCAFQSISKSEEFSGKVFVILLYVRRGGVGVLAPSTDQHTQVKTLSHGIKSWFFIIFEEKKSQTLHIIWCHNMDLGEMK